MGEDGRSCRVEADRQVVGNERVHPITNRADAVAVGDHLIVGDHHERFHASELQSDAVGQRAEVVPEMQVAGRSIAGENPKP